MGREDASTEQDIGESRRPVQPERTLPVPPFDSLVLPQETSREQICLISAAMAMAIS